MVIFFSKSSPERERQQPWDLVFSILDKGPTKFVQIMILGKTSPTLLNITVEFASCLMHLNGIFSEKADF